MEFFKLCITDFGLVKDPMRDDYVVVNHIITMGSLGAWFVTPDDVKKNSFLWLQDGRALLVKKVKKIDDYNHVRVVLFLRKNERFSFKKGDKLIKA